MSNLTPEKPKNHDDENDDYWINEFYMAVVKTQPNIPKNIIKPCCGGKERREILKNAAANKK